MAAVRDLILNLQERKEGNALTSAANDLEKLSRGVDATGNAMHGMESDAKKLNAEIQRTNLRIKDLHKQFASTGDESLFGDIRKEETRLRNLEKTFKALGTQAGTSFLGGLSSTFEGVGSPVGIGVAAGVAAALVIPLGAAVAGAVVGAVGTGGVIGGVLAASHDPQVKGAFQGLAQQAKDAFFGAGGSFVDPVLKSTAILSKTLDKVNLSSIFSKAAPDLEIIVQGISDLVTNSLPGLNDLLARSKPFAEATARGLAFVGKSLSEFLENISANHGAVEGLEMAFIGLGDAVKFLGVLLTGAAEGLHLFNSVATGTFEILDKTLNMAGLHSDTIHDVAVAGRDLAGATDQVSASGVTAKDVISAVGRAFTEQELATNKAAQGLQRENDELKNTIDLIDQAINQALGLDNAQLALNKDMKDLSDAVAQNGRHWDDNTAAAFANQQAILGALGDLERVRDQEIKMGASVADANAEYEAGLQKILNYAAALGATKEQLDKIKGRYDIVLAFTAIGDVVGNVGKTLAGLIPHFASGGMVPGPTGAAQLAVVHGGERVLTPSQQATIAKGGDGAATPTALRIDFGGGTDSAFATAFMKLVRSGDITISAGAVV